MSVIDTTQAALTALAAALDIATALHRTRAARRHRRTTPDAAAPTAAPEPDGPPPRNPGSSA